MPPVRLRAVWRESGYHLHRQAAAGPAPHMRRLRLGRSARVEVSRAGEALHRKEGSRTPGLRLPSMRATPRDRATGDVGGLTCGTRDAISDLDCGTTPEHPSAEQHQVGLCGLPAVSDGYSSFGSALPLRARDSAFRRVFFPRSFAAFATSTSCHRPSQRRLIQGECVPTSSSTHAEGKAAKYASKKARLV